MAGFDSSSAACFPVIEMAGFAAVPSSSPAVEMAGFYQPQIPAHCLAIDPQLARDPSLRPSALGQAVNRCLQTHFEDIRRAPLNRFLPVPHAEPPTEPERDIKGERASLVGFEPTNVALPL
jgi:hypothetical protein